MLINYITGQRWPYYFEDSLPEIRILLT